MRTTEEFVRAFVETNPSPKDFSAQSKDDPDLPEKVRAYNRERLAFEVQLEIRDTLRELLKKG